MESVCFRPLQHMRCLSSLILACLLMFLLLPPCLAGKPQTELPALILGVHPYKSATKLTASYKPLAAYLSSKTGRRIIVKISKDYHACKLVNHHKYLIVIVHYLLEYINTVKPLITSQRPGVSLIIGYQVIS